jgi:MoaA/NifB/PqqE/SkfB family radical SAM enzyme
VRRLKEAGLKIPVISLDHYRPEIHDTGRGRRGVHQAALEAIRMFQDQGFYVAVSFVPDRALVEDREELWKIIDFFRELGVNDMRLTSPILSGRLTARPEEKLTPENVRTIHEVQTQCTGAPGYPGVFAYDYFESRRFYGCGAGFNYMFIDSQGNLCPCDFTMMSLGNILERPMADIWGETSRMFRAPGCDCYANVINDTVAARKPKTWPLGPDETREVHAQCPSYDLDDLPEFYRGMSFTPGPGEAQ